MEKNEQGVRMTKERDATISRCGLYRYGLGRAWNPFGHGVCYVMLNPSTADATLDDPTIRRCIGFARTLGFGWLSVVNLFALRATNPDELKRHPDPVGPDNDEAILREADAATTIVCAWGAHPIGRLRAAKVRELLEPRPLRALGVTKYGHPRHPLYLKGDSTLIRWPREG